MVFRISEPLDLTGTTPKTIFGLERGGRGERERGGRRGDGRREPVQVGRALLKIRMKQR